eukprot:288412-Prymnesium_polylepis.1
MFPEATSTTEFFFFNTAPPSRPATTVSIVLPHDLTHSRTTVSLPEGGRVAPFPYEVDPPQRPPGDAPGGFTQARSPVPLSSLIPPPDRQSTVSNICLFLRIERRAPSFRTRFPQRNCNPLATWIRSPPPTLSWHSRHRARPRGPCSRSRCRSRKSTSRRDVGTSELS